MMFERRRLATELAERPPRLRKPSLIKAGAVALHMPKRPQAPLRDSSCTGAAPFRTIRPARLMAACRPVSVNRRASAVGQRPSGSSASGGRRPLVRHTICKSLADADRREPLLRASVC